MREKSSIFLLLAILTCGAVFSQKIAVLPDIIDPEYITICEKRIFIVEASKIHIYALENFKLKRTIGTYGEGPEEFLIEPKKQGYRLQIAPFSGYLLVNSINKASLFTLGGDFVREVKTNSGRYFKPLAGKFIGYKLVEAGENDKTIKISVNLYDKNFVKIKTVFKKDALWQLKKKFNPIYYGIGSLRGVVYHICDQKVFVEGPHDVIHVFDENGIKRNTIELNLDKLKISEHDEQEMLAAIKETRLPRIYQLVKRMAKFPVHFPLKYFNLADSRLYVLSFEKMDSARPFYVYSLTGKRLNKVWLPFEETNILHYNPYTIHQRKFYQLVENIETEKWELHQHKID